jgi:catechol 2,3-dioxygenase
MADRKRRLTAAGLTGESIADGVAVADPWGTQVRLVRA